MRAILLKADSMLTLESIPDPEIDEAEILLKTGAAGLCGSDRRIVRMGSPRISLPAVIGHEISGTISKVGKKVSGWRVGQRVSLNSGIPCGDCKFCDKSFFNLCTQQQMFGFQVQGGLAEYVRIPPNAIKFGVLQKIPEGLTFDLAALAEPLAAMINAFEVMKPAKKSSFLVIGGGSMAIVAAMLAKDLGCSNISVYASRNKYEQLSRLNIPDIDVKCLTEIYDIEDASRYESIMVCADSLKAQDIGMRHLEVRGKIHFFGVVPKREGFLSINSNDVHYWEQTVTGSFGSRPEHLKKAIKYISRNRHDLRKIIDRKYSLDSYESAFASLMNGSAIKVMFVL